MKPIQKNPNLTDEQKSVLFDKATELPYTGALLNNEDNGDYLCANCHNVVFGAETKFDSGCGWPSFYNVKSSKSVRLIEDNSLGMQRVEVVCKNCGGHLGHVFDDSIDQPTNIRFCINSLSLEFILKDKS